VNRSAQDGHRPSVPFVTPSARAWEGVGP
jgi:hypothetical protein